MDNRKKICGVLLIIFLIFPFYVHAAKGGVSDDVQLCLGCHSDKNLAKQLEDKETLSLYVNGGEFAVSVHAALGAASHASARFSDQIFHPDRQCPTAGNAPLQPIARDIDGLQTRPSRQLAG